MKRIIVSELQNLINVVVLILLCRIKIRIRSSYVYPTVVTMNALQPCYYVMIIKKAMNRGLPCIFFITRIYIGFLSSKKDFWSFVIFSRFECLPISHLRPYYIYRYIHILQTDCLISQIFLKQLFSINSPNKASWYL